MPLSLNCLILGDRPRQAFPVEIEETRSVGILKKLIKEEKAHYGHIDASDLQLWKVDFSSDNLETELVNFEPDPSRELSPLKKLSSYFMYVDEPEHLHVIAKAPETHIIDEGGGVRRVRSPELTEERLLKKRRLLSNETPMERTDISMEWEELWSDIWGKSPEYFEKHYTTMYLAKDGQDSFEVMKNHKAFRKLMKGFLVRAEWKFAWEKAVEAWKEVENFIIVGHPGIGKSISLFFFLLKRLADGLPTAFQNQSDYVWFFDEHGAHRINAKDAWYSVKGISAEVRPWALVDSNHTVMDPANFIWNQESPFFIIHAASPRKTRWKWTKYHGRTQYFYTKPFSLDELLQGNELQESPSEIAKICDFYTKYGPSARMCYRACSSPLQMDQYTHDLAVAIRKMNWNMIKAVIQEINVAPTSDADTPHLIMLIEPDDHTRLSAKVNVITRTVSRLLWQTHATHLEIKSQKFINIFSMYPGSAPTAGWAFEHKVHLLLGKGIDVPLDEMTRVNNRTDAVCDHHTSTNVGQGRWISMPMEYVPYTTNQRTLDLQPFRYYVPVDRQFPTCDSFTFEFTSHTDYHGPILSVDGVEVLDVNNYISEIGLFTLFQVTIGETHDVKEKDLNYVIALAQHKKLKVIAIRYIAVITMAAQEVKVASPITWRDKIAMYALNITNYKPEAVLETIL